MNTISVLSILLFSMNVWSEGADIGIQGECHDGTSFEFSVEKGSCQSQMGTYYLVERAGEFCKKHCSVFSGKCAINKLNNIRVQTCNKVLPKMYRGIDVACKNGETLEFNTCSTSNGFDEVAKRMCQGKQGVVEMELKERCN